MRIIRRTDMIEMPSNCLECTEHSCTLPMKQNGFELLKACMTKRHKECKLEVEK